MVSVGTVIEILNKIITNVLTALYQPFWFAVLLSVLFMFFWMYAKEHGLKESLKTWAYQFRGSPYFRRLFLLAFYTTMILFRTLLNRNMWENPLSDVLGNWWIWETGSSGEMTLNTEPIENMMLFIPFIILLLWTIRYSENTGNNGAPGKQLLKDMKLTTILWQAVKITFLFSFTIEFLQLFLRLGTWQISDMFYNTSGGFIGGLIYWICYRVKHRGNVK